MSRQGVSGVTFQDDPLIAIGAGKSVKNTSDAPLTRRDFTVTDTKQVLASHSPSFATPPNSGEVVSLVSTEADTAVIQVEGLDENFLRKVVQVALTGTTPVAVPGLWTRINFLTVVDPVTPEGLVQISGAEVYAEILVGVGRALTGIYSAPVDSTLQVIDVIGTMVSTQGNADVGGAIFISYRPIVKVGADWVTFALVEAFAFGLQRSGASIAHLPLRIPASADGPVDVLIEGQVTTANTVLSTRMTILLETV